MTYFFAEFEVDDVEFRFSVLGEQVTLEPKVLRLLIYLLQNPNRLVRKKELLDALWPAAVVTENALTRVVGLLRKALGDDSQNPRFLQTVPTAGYRFIAEVRVGPDQCNTISQPDVEPAILTSAGQNADPPAALGHQARQRRRWPIAAVAFFVVLFIVAFFALWRSRSHSDQPPSARTLTATHPSQSPATVEGGFASQTHNPAAYDAFVRARFLFFNEISHGDDIQYADATREVETATRLEPQFAEPYALLAQILERSVHHGRGNVSEEYARSYLLADKALALDPRCSLAHVVLGELHADKEGDFRWEAAVRELKTALTFNPSDAFAHGLLGDIYVRTGLLDSAMEQAEIAHRLDPSFNNYTGVKIRVLEYQQHFQEASDLCANLAESYCAVLLWESGQHEQAWTAMQPDLKRPPDKSSLYYLIPTYHAFLLAKRGERREADRVIQSILNTVNRKSDTFFAFSEYRLGVTYAVLGEQAKAIDLLESASFDGFPCYPMYANDPELAPVRANPRFVALLDRLHRQNELFRKTLL